MKRKRIGIVHPRMTGFGGSELRPCWIAESLKKDFNITFITMGDVDLDKLNAYSGSEISREQVDILSIPIPAVFKNRFDALRAYQLSRLCRKIAGQFDVMISTYNLMDFGRRGIQFIADLSFNDNVRRELDSSDHGLRKWFYRSSALRRMYLGLGRRMNGGNPDAWKMNVTIANSVWTQKVFHERYHIKSQVIYPPVPGKFPEVDWKRREDGFVYIGRISPEKRIEELVHILDRVRNKGMNIHFHIYGKLGNNYYARKIQQLCEKKRDWIFLEGVVMGDQKIRALSQHKYGISGRRAEPFGISVAEMIKAGCITWVPDAGGQVEIVNTTELTYNDVEEAVHKIELILGSSALQLKLRKHLIIQSKRFSVEKFMQEVYALVRKFFRATS